MKYFIYIIFFLAFILRLAKLVPNMELVTAGMLLSSLYFPRTKTLKLVLLLMAATDLIIGNTGIFIFTWTGFLLPALLVPSLFKKIRLPTIITASGLGVFSNLFFYVWTNFGVWLLDSWGMYPKTISGLLNCYINGLPFLRPQLQSTLLFVPLVFFIVNHITRLAVFKELRFNTGTVPQP